MTYSTAAKLNRALSLVARSYPRYLLYSRSYVPPGSESAIDTLHDIADDQAYMAERIADALMVAGYPPSYGEFSMDYTSSHDLGIEHQVRQAIDYQRQDVAELESISDELAIAAQSRTLVDESLGMAQAHLELLLAAERAIGQCRPAMQA